MTEELQLQLAEGRTVAARTWGPATGVPVLAVHGWLDNANSWDGLAPLLPECRVVAIDLPGHGLSQHRPEGERLHFVDGVFDLCEILDALRWHGVVYLGHSMGAGLGTLLASSQPERVRSLVLLDQIGPFADPADEAPQRLTRALSHNTRERFGKRAYASPEEAVEALVRATGMRPASALTLVERGLSPVTTSGQPASSSPAAAQRLGTDRSTETQWVWRADSRLRAPSPLRLTPELVCAFLRCIRCPALLIRARSTPLSVRQPLAEQIAAVADIRVEELEGGHHVHLDDPQPVAILIRAFLGL